MSEGMQANVDKFTTADIEALRARHYSERPRTETFVREVEGGTIVQGEERREVFTFEAPGEGSWRFDVRQIKDAIVGGRIKAAMFRIPEVPESFFTHVLEHNGVEPDRLARIQERDLERPGIMVWWGNHDGHSTLIDGNHRLCRRWLLGKKDFRFIMVDVTDLADFMCRPGDEERLFGKRERPGYETLHIDIHLEGIDENDR